MNRYFSLIPLVILITTACDRKAPQITRCRGWSKSPRWLPSVIHSSAYSPPALSPGIPPIYLLNAAGKLNRLMYVRGRYYSGQPLARLSAREAQQRVNERQTAATLAQRQFDRFQTLAGRRDFKGGNGYPAGQPRRGQRRAENRPRRAVANDVDRPVQRRCRLRPGT